MKKSIPLGSLSIGELLAQDIYDEQNRLLLKAGTHLSDQYITSLQAKGIETVLVKKYKLNPNNWLVFKNPTGKLHIVHRDTRSKRVISY